jgi:hypothetical protein
MTNVFKFLLLLFLTMCVSTGCQVTEEKIETWKGTQNGPKKLAGTLIDPSIDINLRVKAAVALVEMNEWGKFKESFPKMEKSDSEKVILALAPILGELSRGEGGGPQEKSLAKMQVDAKDGLYLMLDYVQPGSRNAVIEPLLAWCVEGNYNIRAMAGYNVRAVVKKIGEPATDALATLLTTDQIAIEPIAKLIVDVNNKSSNKKASEFLSKQLKTNFKQIGEKHLVAAAIIGGHAIADTLLDLATDKNLTDELQRFALRAYSQSLTNGSIKATRKQIDILFVMAENTEFDKFQREETYLTIAQAGGPRDSERMTKLLTNEVFFWRLVGLRCLLRMDGKNQLAGALNTKKLARDNEEISEVIIWTSRFPKFVEQIRAVLKGGNAFAKGVAVYALGVVGSLDKDVPMLEGLLNNKTRLPDGFDHKTLGEAAKAAINEIKKKG